MRGQFSAVVLSDIYPFNELVHGRKSRTPSDDVSSECLGVLIRIDLQSSACEHMLPAPVCPEETDEGALFEVDQNIARASFSSVPCKICTTAPYNDMALRDTIYVNVEEYILKELRGNAGSEQHRSLRIQAISPISGNKRLCLMAYSLHFPALLPPSPLTLKSNTRTPHPVVTSLASCFRPSRTSNQPSSERTSYTA